MTRLIRTLVLPALLASAGLAPLHAADLLRGTLGGPTGGESLPGAGYYVGARGGITVSSDSAFQTGSTELSRTTQRIPAYFDTTSLQVVGPFTITTVRNLNARINQAYDNGVNYSGFVGYDFGTFVDGFSARIEAEVGRFRQTVNTQTVTGIDQTTTIVTGPTSTQVTADPALFAGAAYSGVNAMGRTTVTYGLANYYVDLDLGRFRPFVGAGVGIAQLDFSEHGFNGSTVMNDSNWGWAYQFGGGASFELLPSLVLEAGYRVLGVRDVTLTGTGGNDTRVNLTTQQANVGVRLRF